MAYTACARRFATGPVLNTRDFAMKPEFDLKAHVRHVPDFPKPGILFYDISTLLINPEAWRETVDRLKVAIEPYQPTKLVGIESRGFLVSAPLAYLLGIGFVMVRKRGKLPGEVIRHNYDLEYGQDVVEVQADAIKPGERVVVLDDLLATGGTMAAAIQLLRQVGAEVVAAASIIELTFLAGRARLDVPFSTILSYDS
jgi:adenine phosphoribosyltransferase